MDKRHLSLSALTALSLALAAPLAGAQTSDSQSPSGGSARAAATGKAATLAGADRQFVERAASGGKAEVRMGQMAQQKAASTEVKVFAARMVQDHTMANNQLAQLAQAKGVAVPAEPEKAHGDMEKLGKLSGADFDRQYIDHMVSDHRKTVAEFKKASESAKDLEVKAFAGETLPKLQDHLNQAQTIQAKVKSASKQ